MKRKWMCVLLVFVCLAFSSAAFGQLDYGEDFTTSDALWSVTHVKVNSNMIPYYLEGIQRTWASANKVAMDLGHIADYKMYVNMLSDSGDYNLTLVIKFDNLAQYEKGRTDYKAFEEAWENRIPEEEREEIVMSYPDMRKIVGEYLMREVSLK